MAKARQEKTLADYVTIALSPLLIMAMAGSLAFFLLELAYSGGYTDKLRWTLFCFVFASVLVGRIAIEQGSEHASLFGLALAGVTALAAFRLAPDGALAGLAVLAVIWWLVHRLTFDCTLIDDSVDSSGEGLLQASGLDPEEGGKPSRKKTGWWTSLFGAAQASRAPGTWVVYFSVAALPLFGVGQVLIPAADSGRREFAFWMLAIHVGSALGLLLTTSFLGLRRYLRQRRLKMPAPMAGIWLGTGLLLIGAILGGCFLLPRPDHSASPGDLWRTVADATQKASEFAQGGKEPGEGEGRELGQKPEDKPQDQQPKDKEDARRDQPEANPPEADPNAERDPNGAQQRPGEGQPADRGEGQKSDEAGQQQENDAPKGQKQPGGDKQQVAKEPRKEREADNPARDADPKDARQQPDQQVAENREPGGKEQPEANAEPESADPPSPAMNPAEWFSWMGEHWRVVVWLIFGTAGAIFLVRNWQGCLEFLNRLWAAFLGLFGIAGGTRVESGESEPVEESVAPLRPFSEMQNPFATGEDSRMKPADVLRLTFVGLQAWAHEAGHPRRRDQTPLEFVQAISANAPQLAQDAREVAQMYSRLIYAGQAPSRNDLEPMQRLWRRMEASLMTSN